MVSTSFEVFDPLTPSDARQYSTLFVLPVLRNDDCDRLTYGFFASVAEDALRTFVPASDNAVEIFANNRVVTRLNNRRQKTQLLFRLSTIVFELPAVTSIAIYFNHRAVTEQSCCRVSTTTSRPSLQT